MKHLDLLNIFREQMARVVVEVTSSVAMGHFDINKVSENLTCGLFRNLYGFSKLRSLNAEQRKNFPGIDLADDEARVAIQVTSDGSLDKIKDTLSKFIKHGLHKNYNRIIIHILTKKQTSYSATSIGKICAGCVQFDVRRDILDSSDISTKAANAEPRQLQSAVDCLLSYTRGYDVGLAEEDFDPPSEPPEHLGTNLVEFFFPSRLFIADIRARAISTETGRTVRNQRKGVKDYGRALGFSTPSDFEAIGKRLVTFHDLESSTNPFRDLIEEGTVESFAPSDFYRIDADHERVFKSLLRFVLQQKLYKHGVLWQHHESKFIFVPTTAGQNKRSEMWMGQRASSRMVFERKFKTNKPSEVLSTRHLAFSAEFIRLGDAWYFAITPDWFFSYGDDYLRSRFGDKLLSGLKRMEKNRSVYDQFRFMASWLSRIDSEDLFFDRTEGVPTLSFADPLQLPGGRALNENLWAPLEAPEEDGLQERLGAF